MAAEAAVVLRKRSADFIRARSALEALHTQAGYMTASVLFHVSVRPLLDIVGGSIYVAKIKKYGSVGCNLLKYEDTILDKSLKNQFLQQNRCRSHRGLESAPGGAAPVTTHLRMALFSVSV
jgi:hypothetical protein